MLKEIVKVMKTGLVITIKAYQLTRFFRKSCCRFYPSCSDYSIQAIEEKGVFKGMVLTFARLAKCHPWYQEG